MKDRAARPESYKTSLSTWFTDTHLNIPFSFAKDRIVEHFESARPERLFLTGDTSDGLNLKRDLSYLARRIDVPIYFTLGNHCFHFRKMSDVYKEIRELCQQYDNLVWVPDSQGIPLTENTVLIGADGWYDCEVGNSDYITYTSDWVCIEEFSKLPDMSARLRAFRDLVARDIAIVKNQLDCCIDKFQKIIMMTHVPPWSRSVKTDDSPSSQFWLPYNVNYALGLFLETYMANHPDKHLTVLSGHTHNQSHVDICDNIESIVGQPFVEGGRALEIA